MPQVASTGAAVAVADFDKDGWQDFYVTNSREGSLNRLYRNKGTARSRTLRNRLVLRMSTAARPASRWVPSGATTTTTATTICSSIATDSRSSFTTKAGQRFAATGTGFPRWVNANAATWLDYDRDGRLDLFLAGYWPDDVDLWKLTDVAHHAGELRVRQQRWTEVPVAQSRRRRIRGRDGSRGNHEPAMDAGGDRSRSAGLWLSRLVPRQRLRRLRDVRQSWRQTFRGCRCGDWRGTCAEERDERGARRRLQRRAPVDLQDEHLRAGATRAGQRSVGAEGSRIGSSDFREPGDDAGRRPRGMELGRAVRRSEQRRRAGYLPGQRLHLSG